MRFKSFDLNSGRTGNDRGKCSNTGLRSIESKLRMAQMKFIFAPFRRQNTVTAARSRQLESLSGDIECGSTSVYSRTRKSTCVKIAFVFPDEADSGDQNYGNAQTTQDKVGDGGGFDPIFSKVKRESEGFSPCKMQFISMEDDLESRPRGRGSLGPEILPGKGSAPEENIPGEFAECTNRSSSLAWETLV